MEIKLRKRLKTSVPFKEENFHQTPGNKYTSLLSMYIYRMVVLIDVDM